MWKRTPPSIRDFRSSPLLPSAKAALPGTLMGRDRIPPEIVDRHDLGGDIGAVSVFEVTGAEYGGLGILRLSGEPFVPAECYPDYMPQILTDCMRSNPEHIWCGALFARRRKKISVDSPILAPFNPNFIYGHFLLEMLAPLLILDRWDTTGAPLALSSRTPNWVRQIVETLAPARKIVWFDSTFETLVAPTVFLPSSTQGTNNHLHPALRTLISDFKQRLGVDASAVATKRLYLSRSRKSDVGSWHRLRNESAIESMFADQGFEIVHPQDIAFKDQIALYDQADVIAGEFSSALHNSLFARPQCKVFAINWINWYQSRVAALMDQSVAYVPTKAGFIDWSRQSQGFQHLDVDVELVRRELIPLLDSQDTASRAATH